MMTPMVMKEPTRAVFPAQLINRPQLVMKQ
jgi:hypothetical protein